MEVKVRDTEQEGPAFARPPVCVSSPAIVSERSWGSGIRRNLGVRLGKSAAGVVERGSEGASTGLVLSFLARGGFGLVPSGSSRAGQIEQELRNLNGAEADPTERELGNLNSVGADPTEQELGNLNGAARAYLTEHGLGNSVGADPTERGLGNLNGAARAYLTEHERGNCYIARVDPTEQELGNWNGFYQG
ncbi:hypothetical protein B296_00048376 [Ensete ventricosum]|uniref:Uncharacterized protein n=1 Tax=Ensete ventricosum TaxID=4639 RepID=A0A426WY75_ENSVE|nr:hypothetical protein B296_00048376 [Ensete ventricosum]